jgi:hypothetical protein
LQVRDIWDIPVFKQAHHFLSMDPLFFGPKRHKRLGVGYESPKLNASGFHRLRVRGFKDIQFRNSNVNKNTRIRTKAPPGFITPTSDKFPKNQEGAEGFFTMDLGEAAEAADARIRATKQPGNPKKKLVVNVVLDEAVEKTPALATGTNSSGRKWEYDPDLETIVWDFNELEFAPKPPDEFINSGLPIKVRIFQRDAPRSHVAHPMTYDDGAPLLTTVLPDKYVQEHYHAYYDPPANAIGSTTSPAGQGGAHQQIIETQVQPLGDGTWKYDPDLGIIVWDFNEADFVPKPPDEFIDSGLPIHVRQFKRDPHRSHVVYPATNADGSPVFISVLPIGYDPNYHTIYDPPAYGVESNLNRTESLDIDTWASLLGDTHSTPPQLQQLADSPKGYPGGGGFSPSRFGRAGAAHQAARTSGGRPWTEVLYQNAVRDIVTLDEDRDENHHYGVYYSQLY